MTVRVEPAMRVAIAMVGLAGCWQAPPVAPPVPPATVAEPPRLIAGGVVLAWDGDNLAQAPDSVARFNARDDGELTVGTELALVGCVGLLGRARLTEHGEHGWSYELIARASLWTPTRTCRTGESIAAFAVSPAERVHDGGRGEADLPALYASLPTRYRRWHEASRASTRQLALWADLDADGTIDLVELAGPCVPDDAANCTAILARDTAWRRVGGTAESIFY